MKRTIQYLLSSFLIFVLCAAVSAKAQSTAEWNEFKRKNGIDPKVTYNDWKAREGGRASFTVPAAPPGPTKEQLEQKDLAEASDDFVDKGNKYYKESQWAQAVAYYKKALNYNPENEDAVHNLNIAQRKIQEAQAWLDAEEKRQEQARLEAQNHERDSRLKDAVANDSDDKKVFKTKTAIQDVLSASAYGEDANNPDLGAALERAKVETNKKFDRDAPDRGHFDTIVIAGDADPPRQSQAQTVQVPVELQNDRRFQKLVIERDALQNQDQELGKQIQSIKADPAYAQDSKSLTRLDQLQSAQNGLHGMSGYLNNVTKDVVNKTVSIGTLDFSDSGPPQKSLDSIVVPPPTQ